MTTAISASSIKRIGQSIDTSSSNGGSYIFIETNEDSNYGGEVLIALGDITFLGNVLIVDLGVYREECTVIMAPAEDANPAIVPFLLMNQKNQLVRHAAGGEFRKYISLGFKPQHLYICSSGKIEDGDWVYHPLDGKIFHGHHSLY